VATPDERARLADQQQVLVRALVGGGTSPPGFDAERLRAAADSLVAKRVREVARAWPALAAELGYSFGDRFVAHAAAHPPPEQGGPLADGRAFLRCLPRARWSDTLRLAVLGVDLHFRRVGGGLRQRRGPAVRAVWLRESGRLVLALRLPGRAGGGRSLVWSISWPRGGGRGRKPVAGVSGFLVQSPSIEPPVP
jgi:hypothetical protein